MTKMNKKGFTLIEMLVVIAIIAVLVSIIIPTVTSATDKAEAASIAANLRSVKAEIVTAMLTEDTTNTWHGVETAANASTGAVTLTDAQATYVKGVFGEAADATTKFTLNILNDVVTVEYDGDNIAEWAAKAE